MMRRAWLASGLFVALMAGAVAALAMQPGELSRLPWALIYVAGIVGAVSLAAAWALPVTWLNRALATLVLAGGSVLFAFPFVWMLSTSFKYPEEIFVYPPRWLPAIPPVVAVSPYVTFEELKEAPPPKELAADRWASLWPRIQQVLWARARDGLPTEPMAGLEESAIRRAMVQGLWRSVSAAIPQSVWRETDEAILRAVEDRVGPDRIQDVWMQAYRGVAVRDVTVRDDAYVDHPLAAEDSFLDAWHNAGEAPLRVMIEPAGQARGREPVAHVAYDLRQHPEAVMEATFPLPIEASRWLAVTLPMRQDRSWHRLHVEVEVQGVRYRLEDKLYLDQHRWQELTFKFKHKDARDERDLGIWPLVATAAADAHNEPGRFLIRLRFEQRPWLENLWHKYTGNYRQAMITTPYGWRYVRNSAALVLLNLIGQLVSCSLVAYAFARLQWPGRDALFVVLLTTMMLPPQVTMIPVFMIFRALGWYNTLRPLWVPSFFGSAFFIFLLRQFMKTIPTDLEDAARIDGCGVFGIYWRIILPLMKPALAAVGIFTFMNSWNEFLGPLIYLNDRRLYPLALGLFDFRTEHSSEFGLLMAASTLMTLPVVALFFLAQRYFIQGVTLTGLKG